MFLYQHNPKKDLEKRYVPLTTAAKESGIPLTTLRRWVKRGAPHKKINLGGTHFKYLVNIEDIKTWAISEREQSIASFGTKIFEKRISSSAASDRLLDIKNKLKLTIKEMANLLEISEQTLSSYLYATNRRKTIPTHVVSAAELLLDTGEARLSKENLRRVLIETGGVITNAAIQLHLSKPRLRNLIKEYNLGHLVKHKEIADRLTLTEIYDALGQARTLVETATILGVSERALRLLIKNFEIDYKNYLNRF